MPSLLLMKEYRLSNVFRECVLLVENLWIEGWDRRDGWQLMVRLGLMTLLMSKCLLIVGSNTGLVT